MQITGNNLQRVADALELADAELHNQIATCPDFVKHADAIDELEHERDQLRVLRQRVLRAIEREAKQA